MKTRGFFTISPRNPWKCRRAFTLVEMLVAVAILIFLAMLLIPGIKGVVSKSQGVHCMSNLRQIGLGVASYTAEHNGAFPRGGWNDGNGVPFEQPYLDGIAWLSDIYPYVGENRDIFVCPSGKNQSPTGLSSWIRMPGGKSSDPKYPFHYAYNAHLNSNRLNLLNNTHVQAFVNRVAAVRNLSGLPVMIDIVFQNNFSGDFPVFEPNPSDTAAQIFAARHSERGNVLWGDGSVSSMTFKEWVSAPATRISSGSWKNYRFCTGNYP